MLNPLTRALPWVARMVARQCGIEVRFDPRAVTASINANRVITLPNVPAGDQKSAALALGYIVHEAFHVKYSDFEVINEARSLIEESFLGLFEDARIEALGMVGYPGARMYLSQAWQIIYERGGVLRPTGDPITPVKDVFAYTLAYCRAMCLDMDIAKHDLSIARGVVVQRLGEEVAERLETIFSRVTNCISTWQSLLLARETLQCLYEATGEKPVAGRQQGGLAPPPMPQPQAGYDKSSPQASPGPQGAEHQSPCAQAPQQQSDDDQVVGAQPEGAPLPVYSSEPTSGAGDDASASEVDEAVHQRAQGEDVDARSGASKGSSAAGVTTPAGADVDAGGGGGTDQSATDGSQSAPGATDANSSAGGAEEGSPITTSWQSDDDFRQLLRDDLASVAGDAGGILAQHLNEVIVEAKFRSGRQGGESVMLNSAELVDPEDYEQSQAHAAELLARTAAATASLRATIRHLLVSLTDEDVRYAARGRVKPTRLWRLRAGTQNVFEQTVDGVEINTAVTVLLDVSSSMKGHRLRLATEAMAAVALAIDGVAGISTSVCSFPGRTAQHVNRLKRFGESAQRASARFAGVKASGCTPLAEALYAVGAELVEQCAGGHLLVVVTDGEPDCAVKASLALRELVQEGVDIVGVGIGCDVSHLFDQSIELRDQRELAPKLFEVLSERFNSYAALAA